MKFPTRFAAPLVAAALAVSGAAAIIPAQAGIPAAQQAGNTPAATVSKVTDPASGEGRPGDVERPEWSQLFVDNQRSFEYWVYSPSMKRHIPFYVQAPADTSAPRPILYVLNGGDGGEQNANWLYQTDLARFYANKNVWIVMPMSGAFSYYSDWVNDGPGDQGRQMWETFLTKELPGPLEQELGASSKRGIIGMSMSATTTILYAEHHPGFYDAVGSFSGCAETSRGLPLEYLRITLNRGHGSPEQMWGPIGGDTFNYNDGLQGAARLKGTPHIYVSTGTGLLGPHDLLSSRFVNGDIGVMFLHGVNGGIIEAAVNKCTHDLKAKTDAAGITGIDWNFRPYGTHSWGYWQQDLRDSWPTFARAFGQDPGAPVPMGDSDIAQPVTPDAVTDIWKAAAGDNPHPVTQPDPSPAGTGTVDPAAPTDPADTSPADTSPVDDTPDDQPLTGTDPADSPQPTGGDTPQPQPAGVPEIPAQPQPAGVPEIPAQPQPAGVPEIPAQPQPADTPQPATGQQVGAPVRFAVPAIL